LCNTLISFFGMKTNCNCPWSIGLLSFSWFFF
jgi:hypothetical protein